MRGGAVLGPVDRSARRCRPCRGGAAGVRHRRAADGERAARGGDGRHRVDRMLSSRRRQAIPALSATVLILLAVAPHLAVDVGFALSVLATAALVVIAPAWSRRLVGGAAPSRWRMRSPSRAPHTW